MFTDDNNEGLELLTSPDYFWDGINNDTSNKENILEEVIWSIGILNTPQKTYSDWANSLDTPT